MNKWLTRQAKAPVERTLPILRRLLREGYDEVTFKPGMTACPTCRRHRQEKKDLQDLINEAEYAAPIYTWAEHPGCQCEIEVTGPDLETVRLNFSGEV